MIPFSKNCAALLALCLGSVAAQAAESSLVYLGATGKLVYKQHANTGESSAVNLMIDFSHAGYKGGGVPLPIVPVKATISPDGDNNDDTTRIQAAIDAVSNLPRDASGFRGAVLLKKGSYRVGANLSKDRGALLIRKSGVVLRGEGQGADGTVIRSYYDNNHKLIQSAADADSDEAEYAPISSTVRRISDAYVGSGQKSFSVSSTSGYAVGDEIYVSVTPNSTWLSTIKVNDYVASGHEWTTEQYVVHMERRITAISGNQITVQAPITIPLQSRFGGGQISKFQVTTGQRLEQIGVEYMRLIHMNGNNADRMEYGVEHKSVRDCWVRGVTVFASQNGAVRLKDGHHCTIEDVANRDPQGPKEGGFRYTFSVSGSFNLFQRTYAEDGRHDYVLSTRRPGPNVFLDGYTIEGGTAGPHQRWATGTLFDSLKLQSTMAPAENRGDSGSGHGWSGAQMVAWNTESPKIICNTPIGFMCYAVGNIGIKGAGDYISVGRPGVFYGSFESHGQHVDTRSLYIRQLLDRVGPSAVSQITTERQRAGFIWDQLAAWKGDGPFPGAPAGGDNGGGGGGGGNTTPYLTENFDSIGGVFKCSKSSCSWTSAPFSIAGAPGLTITANARSYEADKMEDSDYLRMSFSIDGGAWTPFFDHINDLGTRLVSRYIGKTGSKMLIKIEARTSDTNETFDVDNLVVR